MSLPEQYKWLESVKGLPKTIQLALKELGIAEVVGKGSNRTIIAWRDELNLAGVKIDGYSDDDIPWCGLFVAVITYRRMRIPREPVKDPLWALNWAKYGVKSPQAALGDVLVFKRPSGGHVGFYVGEDATAYHVLGGNQGNRVSIVRIAKDRCVAVRRPYYISTPAGVKPFHLSASGQISTNEA